MSYISETQAKTDRLTMIGWLTRFALDRRRPHRGYRSVRILRRMVQYRRVDAWPVRRQI